MSLENDYYGSEKSLRVVVGALLDLLRLAIEATRGTVQQRHTDMLENSYEILESAHRELNEGE